MVKIYTRIETGSGKTNNKIHIRMLAYCYCANR